MRLVAAGIEDKIKSLAAKRNMKDDTIGPVITWTTEAMLGHVDKLLQIPGARLAFGGKELQDHTIPKVYGAIEPTAVFVPLKEILKDEETFKIVTTEVFGPLQVCCPPFPPICTSSGSLPSNPPFIPLTPTLGAAVMLAHWVTLSSTLLLQLDDHKACQCMSCTQLSVLALCVSVQSILL